MIRRPPRSTLFPYTRSSDLRASTPTRGASGWRAKSSPCLADVSWSWCITIDRKSTRLNSSHSQISYAVFCLKKKKKKKKKKQKTKKQKQKKDRERHISRENT